MIQENNYFALKNSQGQANGLRLHYATAGDASKPVMMFLHGFPQAWFVWETLMLHYSRHYFCVAPDLRGFNKSSKPSEIKAYNAKAVVGDIVQLIQELSSTPITLLAHDWGGAMAWNVVVQYPQLIAKFVAINSPHPVPFSRDMPAGKPQASASAYMDWLAQDGSEAALAKDDYALLEGFFKGMGQGDAVWFTPAARQKYHTMWANPSDGTSHPLSGGVNYYRATPLTPAKFAAAPFELKPSDWYVTVPTRVVWGERDLALPPHLLDGLDECIAECSIVRVPHGNHWLIDAYPNDVIAAIGDFV